jgi:beta-fructofuranosidase
LPETCKIEARVTFTEGTRGCGIMLRASEDLESAYYIRIEPHRRRLVLDLWPRAGDVPHMVGLERPLALTPGAPVDLKVFVDGTVCEVYAAGMAMSARLYNLKSGDWGVFVCEGSARFEDLAVTERS